MKWVLIRIWGKNLTSIARCVILNKYVRGAIHTNTIENYFSMLKRGSWEFISMSAHNILRDIQGNLISGIISGKSAMQNVGW
jgi:hypothetical protein